MSDSLRQPSSIVVPEESNRLGETIADIIWRVLRYVLLSLYVLICLYPFAWMVAQALRCGLRLPVAEGETPLVTEADVAGKLVLFDLKDVPHLRPLLETLRQWLRRKSRPSDGTGDDDAPRILDLLPIAAGGRAMLSARLRLRFILPSLANLRSVYMDSLVSSIGLGLPGEGGEMRARIPPADAITQGLPVLTVPGKSFASRFCASIVSAAGVPELICTGPEDYVGKAIAFAKNPESLAAIRQSLRDQRETCALRDMDGLVRRLEELFWQMQGNAERGETPVPDLRNLNVYYEVGAELAAAAIEFESEQAYRQRYLDQLKLMDEHAPLTPDARLWKGAAG